VPAQRSRSAASSGPLEAPASAATLGDLGESGILSRVFARLPGSPSVEVGPGDDAAVVAAPDGRVVATTDLMVEGRDFRRDWSTAYDVGWKAAAQNLADVAAMGAVPTALLVGLVAPPTLDVSWVEGLADGLAAACSGTGSTVVGGDLSSGETVVVSVTALGDLEGRGPVLRSGARPGDVVAVAGRLGWSAAGLALLEAGAVDAAPELVDAHRRPHPPYAAGPSAARAGATAMLDVSDGLLRDAARLATASEVSLDLDPKALLERAVPLAAAAASLGQPALAWRWVLSGGEDHPLLATFAPGDLPPGFAAVGSVVGRTDEPVLVGGSAPTGVAAGWDHFERQEKGGAGPV
jgi:thiamine-monophosphate kinase